MLKFSARMASKHKLNAEWIDMWTLNALPDCKAHHQFLDVGKQYEVLRIVGNGFVIQTSNPELQVVILQERFSRDA